MKINDILTGILIGAFAAALSLYSLTLPQMPGQNVGPGMFPQLIAIGFMVCAATLILRGIKTSPRSAWIKMPDEFSDVRNIFRFLLVPATLVIYIWLADWLGFILTAALLLLALFLAFKVRLRSALIVAILGSLCIHYLFYKLLEVPLSWGLLDSIAW